jgi:hypothetical protein
MLDSRLIWDLVALLELRHIVASHDEIWCVLYCLGFDLFLE